MKKRSKAKKVDEIRWAHIDKDNGEITSIFCLGTSRFSGVNV